MGRKTVDHWPARISKTEQLCHFVKAPRPHHLVYAQCFDTPSGSALLSQIKMGVRPKRLTLGPGNLRRGCPFALPRANRVNVAFKVIYSNERFRKRIRQGFRVADPHQQRPGQARTLSDREGIDRFVGLPRFGERLSDHWNDGSKMLPRGEFGNDATVRLVSCKLRGHNVRNQLFARTDNGGGGFVA